MICAYLTLDSLVNARRILISVHGRCAARKRGRTAAARDYRSSGALGAAASSFSPSFLREHKGPCSILVRYINLTSSAGACARHFLVMDAARLVPAPHLRDENLIEGAGASILEQRNGRGTAEEQ